MIFNDILKQVSEELDIPQEVVTKAYKSYWEFIKKTIENLSLKDNSLNEEEFNKIKTSFNIPSIGKLSCNYHKMIFIKDRYKTYKELENVKN